MQATDFIRPWTQEPFPDAIKKEANLALDQAEKGLTSDSIEAFSIPLEFGTGGIRGKIGNGIGRMNEYTVGRASLGFARYLVKKSKKPSLVIAYDSRHMSVRFCEVAAGIAASLGIKVYYFDEVTPTPILSYAVRYYKATGGIVLTASHNPPEYNGFKAYLSDGGQLVPPDDAKIIKAIESIQDWNEINFLSKSDPIYKKRVQKVSKDCFKSYLKDLEKSGIISDSVKKKDRAGLSIVYSPLHGTGAKYMKNTLKKFGYSNVFLVPEQSEPNPDFPTVAFPNPEEKEAMVLCEKWARERNAQVFIATDPDADRLGIGVLNREGNYTLLNGNQIGSILAAYLCERVRFSSKKKKTDFYLVKTIVTTDLQEKIAQQNKIKLKNVLTGFKYIAEVMKSIDSKKNAKFLFGGEESYGYLPVDFVRDKDALSSALLLLEVIAEKKDILDYLDSIYLQYGLYLEGLKSLTLEGSSGKEKINNSINSLRTQDLIGRKIGNREIVSIIDYKQKLVKGLAKDSIFKGMPPSNVIQVELSGNAKLTIRPSGTEPKVKIYSSFASLIQPKNRSEIPGCMSELQKELKVSESEFCKLAGLE
ncbi:phospho-sugar mutase [Leptospira sp. GIMC2001]|uniref:phospho-sugar mutase n=1 Tax=Leptospira sp. GIMC2001 TaxID=1513297 RepID=UPI0023491F65|nr:phospho-sugar mutase [Leptospira sp. GIMC2001]WCL48633.1 phospho-sugar mutase [Leptospira sp. GIMC2001]